MTFRGKRVNRSRRELLLPLRTISFTLDLTVSLTLLPEDEKQIQK